jgi:hypothetical protein
VDKATQPQSQDEQDGKEKPLEELEKLEGEDEIRVKHLNGVGHLQVILHFCSYMTDAPQVTMPSLPIFTSAQKNTRSCKRRGDGAGEKKQYFGGSVPTVRKSLPNSVMLIQSLLLATPAAPPILSSPSSYQHP